MIYGILPTKACMLLHPLRLFMSLVPLVQNDVKHVVSFALPNACRQSRSTILHHTLYSPETPWPASCPLDLGDLRMVLDSASPVPTSSTTAAGQAGDDDVEERNDAGDDGLQNGTDAVNDGHEASTNGLEDGFDLCENASQQSPLIILVRDGLIKQ